MTDRALKSLLRQAIKLIETGAEELETSYWDFGADRIEPWDIRQEVKRMRKWIEKAKAACDGRREGK